jgi:hypothetical protein
MKKIFLIAAGTVTGLGAILSITPPALSGVVSAPGLAGGATTSTKSATTPVETTVAPTPSQRAVSTGFSGTVNGDAFNARNYGTVSVSATFADGKIKSVSASQSPRSWSQQSLTVLIPYVNAGSITVEQVKAHSAASLPCTRSNSCNSQASYTAEAFWASLKTAITKAGL